MNENNMKNKKKIIIIASGFVVSIVILLLIVGNAVQKGSIKTKSDEKRELNGITLVEGIATDTNRHEISMNATQCVGTICIRDVILKSYADRGQVEFTFVNNGTEPQSGELNLKLGNYTALVAYRNVPAGGTSPGMYGYTGANLQSVDNFTVSLPSSLDSRFLKDE